MAAHYSIISYVPDPIADERINVGVIVLGDQGAHLRFLHRWDRVKGFADGDIKFLKGFARDLQDRQMVLGNVQEAWTLENLNRYASEWRRSIQFSEPRASLQPAEELVDEIARRFLVDTVAPVYNYRTRSGAIKLAVRTVGAVLRERLGPVQANELLKTRYVLAGARAPHHFDVVAANGRPIFAAQALSLEVPDARSAERDINAAGWSLLDVKNQVPDFPTSILALIPEHAGLDAGQHDNIQRVVGIAEQLQIPLHRDLASLERWSDEQIRQIA